LEEIIGLLDLSSNLLHSESRVAVAEAQHQFGNPEERKLPPLDAVTRELVKRQQTGKTQCVL
jgi:hypothetical protein